MAENGMIFKYVSLKEDDASKVWQLVDFPEDFQQILLRRHPKHCFLKKGVQIFKRDRYGIIPKVKCLGCEGFVSTVYSADTCVHVTRIENVTDLKRGDHIGWHRTLGYWHHGIFIEHESKTKIHKSCCCQWHSTARIKVVEYTPYENPSDNSIRVIETYDNYWHNGIDVYRFDYEDCYDPEYTIQLATATARLFKPPENEQTHLHVYRPDYDPFGENCEHFARRCKTGTTKSLQIKDIRHACEISFLRCAILFALAMADNLVYRVGIENDRTQNVHKLVSILVLCFLCIAFLIHVLNRAFSEIRIQGVKLEDYRPAQSLTGINVYCCCCIRVPDECFRCKCLKPCGNRSYVWLICRYVLCRGCCHSAQCCGICRNRCCGKYIRYIRRSRHGRKQLCKQFCTNYFNVALRIIVRELFATVLPVILCFMYQNYWYEIVFGERNILQAFIGFVLSVGVSSIGLGIGHCLGTLAEMMFLSILERCCPRQSNGSDPEDGRGTDPANTSRNSSTQEIIDNNAVVPETADETQPLLSPK